MKCLEASSVGKEPRTIVNFPRSFRRLGGNRTVYGGLLRVAGVVTYPSNGGPHSLGGFYPRHLSKPRLS